MFYLFPFLIRNIEDLFCVCAPVNVLTLHSIHAKLRLEYWATGK